MRTLVIFLVGASVFAFIYWAFRTFAFIDIFSFLFILGVLVLLGWFTLALFRAEAHHG